MAVKRREYLLTVNKFKEPSVLTEKTAVGMLLMRLIMMDPGTDPLHPDMGVGIRKYRYSMDNASELTRRIESQIRTYLPYFADSTISLVYCPDRTLNIEISMEDAVYVYESATAPIPIYLDDIADE